MMSTYLTVSIEQRMILLKKKKLCKIFVKYGWRPGAISKRLLRVLNKAKLRRSVIEEKKTKKAKRNVVPKPTLIISRKDGEYRIEMNEAPNCKDGVDYTPLVYSIEAPDNKARIQRKERKRSQIIRTAIDAAWNDPFHPENCENICQSAYERVLGINVNKNQIFTDYKEDKSMSCSDQEVMSSCSSTDIDWEVQFSPPWALRKQTALEKVK